MRRNKDLFIVRKRRRTMGEAKCLLYCNKQIEYTTTEKHLFGPFALKGNFFLSPISVLIFKSIARFLRRKEKVGDSSAGKNLSKCRVYSIFLGRRGENKIDKKQRYGAAPFSSNFSCPKYVFPGSPSSPDFLHIPFQTGK